jgi:hypothetical protein
VGFSSQVVNQQTSNLQSGFQATVEGIVSDITKAQTDKLLNQTQTMYQMASQSAVVDPLMSAMNNQFDRTTGNIELALGAATSDLTKNMANQYIQFSQDYIENQATMMADMSSKFSGMQDRMLSEFTSLENAIMNTQVAGLSVSGLMDGAQELVLGGGGQILGAGNKVLATVDGLTDGLMKYLPLVVVGMGGYLLVQGKAM